MSLSQKELVLVDKTESLGRRKRISVFSWDEVTRCETKRIGRHIYHVKSMCCVKFPSKCKPLFQIGDPGAREYLWSWTANSKRAGGKQEHPAESLSLPHLAHPFHNTSELDKEVFSSFCKDCNLENHIRLHTIPSSPWSWRTRLFLQIKTHRFCLTLDTLPGHSL